jgi:hypothetical protein
VFDHEAIVYNRREFGLESGFETFKVHVISPFGVTHACAAA